MTEAASIKKVYDEVKALREDIAQIRKHVIDSDRIMTEDEAKRYEKSMRELKKGKTVSLSSLKKEMKLQNV